jgi:hypothetical protein
VASVRFVPVAEMENFYFPNKNTPNIAGVRVELRVEPKTFGTPKCAPGATELGSCLTDATPKAVPGAPSSIRRYVRPERLALAIVAAFLSRWYHIQNLRG